MEILTRAVGGEVVRARAAGPRGGQVDAAFGLVSFDRIPFAARAVLGPEAEGPGGRLGIVEMASASGLALLEPALRDPLRASSLGTGELIGAAAAAGARAILLGVGGSATHDLGLGALGALGLRFGASDGGDIDSLLPDDWPRLQEIRGHMDECLPPVLIACDVDNPLLGARGALSVYGPQKGMDPADMEQLERDTTRVASLLLTHFGRPESLLVRPGAGAAGGIAFGLMTALGAVLLPGFELVSAWLDLDRRLAAADLVITGEGRFDESSLSGKGPGGVAKRALSRGLEVHVFAGKVTLAREVPGLHVHPITPHAMDLSEALEQAPGLLFEALQQALPKG